MSVVLKIRFILGDVSHLAHSMTKPKLAQIDYWQICRAEKERCVRLLAICSKAM